MVRHTGTEPQQSLGYDPLADDPRAYEFDERDLASTAARDPWLDLRQLWPITFRNKWIILVCGALAVAAGLGSTMVATPKYEAFASVQIDQQVTRALGNSDIEPAADIQDSDRYLRTQMDVLNSRALAIRVAEKERLFADDTVFRSMGVIPPDADGKPVSQQQRREAVIGIVRANLGSDLPRDSRLATIRFRSPNPQFAARIANAYAKNFIAANLERKVGTTVDARDLLNNQIATTKQRLEVSERQLNAYARSANLIDTSTPGSTGGVGPRSVTTATLIGLNEALVAATSRRIDAEQRWRVAQSTPAAAMSEVLGNTAIQQLLQQRAERVSQLANERKRRREAFPTIVQGEAGIAELDRQINTIAGRIRSSVEDQYTAARQQERELTAQVQQLKTETLSEQDRSVQYGILRREVETNRVLYDGLLQRFKELSAAANATSNNLSLVDSADPPTRPSSPKPLLNLIAALALGGATAVALIFLRERFDEAVRGPREIETKLGMPILGVVPVLTDNENILSDLSEPLTEVAEAYSSLLVPLSLATRHGLPKSVCITSSEAGEGKTVTAYAIALGLAKRNKRVLLVDADLRRPSLGTYFGDAQNGGLSNVLAQQVTLADAAIRMTQPRLDVLHSGPIPPNPAELLGSEALKSLIETAIANYDIVIFDAPPVLGLADALLLSASVDATLFVFEAGRTKASRARNAVRRLLNVRAQIAGGIVTKFDPSKVGLSHEFARSYFRYGKSEAS